MRQGILMKYTRMLLIICAAMFTGCDSGPRLLQISGNVSYGGKAIDNGMIEFIPVDGTQGPSMGNSIKNGRYEVAKTHGPREGGVYQVRITALRKNGKTAPNMFQPGGPPLELTENYIPGKYNRESTLKTTMTAELASKGIDFNL
jgi:hypothetical protein